MPLNERQIKALREGAVYQIRHARKGTFIGQFLGFDDEPSRLGDPEDRVFLTFKYDIRVGTPQAHLSTGVKIDGTREYAPVRVSNLRPSLIESIQETQEQQWLLEVKVPEFEKPQPQKEPGWLDRLLGRR